MKTNLTVRWVLAWHQAWSKHMIAGHTLHWPWQRTRRRIHRIQQQRCSHRVTLAIRRHHEHRTNEITE